LVHNRAFFLFLGLISLLLPIISPGSATPQPVARPKKGEKPNLGKEVVQQLVGQLNLQECTSPMREGLLAPDQNFAPEEFDLNADRTPEVVIKGKECLCSPTGNCSFWIYRRGGSGYHELLEAEGVHRYHFLSSRSHGYRDLVASMHGSAYDSTVFLFRFDGKRYRLRECYERSYHEIDSKGIEQGVAETESSPNLL
jgi:hypothetical protein